MSQMMYPDYEDNNEELEYEEYYEDYDYATLGDDEEEDIEWEDDSSSMLESFTLQEVMEYCVWPTLSSTASHLLTLLAAVLVFTLVTRTVPIPRWLVHISSTISGSVVLWQVFGYRALYLAGLVLTAYCSVALSALLIKRRVFSHNYGIGLVTYTSVGFLLVCELWLVEATIWHSVRGAQMIILMKVISYAHDVLSHFSPQQLLVAPKNSCDGHETKPEECREEKSPDTKTADHNVRLLRSSKINKSLTETSGEQRMKQQSQKKNTSDKSYQSSREEVKDASILPPKVTERLSSRPNSSTEPNTSHISADFKVTERLSSRSRSSTEPNTSQSVPDSNITDDNNKEISLNMEHFLELCGYLLHPGTVLFGPWCSVASYRQTMLPFNWGWRWVCGVVVHLALSVVFLLASTCAVSWLIPDNIGSWPLAYRDALSFRLSHYFVSHFSEASASLSGLDVGPVARAQHVELPRSLMDVVTYWNRPMHAFLKKYVFIPVRATAGVWCGVLGTYAASALIHGLNGQLCAVLISLALYTHAEHRLRTKLSAAFDACVLARPCRQPCTEHKHTATTQSCLVINLVLGGVCVWHLAYLGVMFDSTPSSATGYSLAHTLEKWRELSFASHWVVGLTYLITFLV